MAQSPWELLRVKWLSLDDTYEFLNTTIPELAVHAATPSANASHDGGTQPQQSCVDALKTLAQEVRKVRHDRKLRAVFEAPVLPIKKVKQEQDPTPPDNDQDHSPDFQKIFKLVQLRGLAQLLPRYLINPQRGVKYFLNNFLLRYMPEVEGVWCAYRKLKAFDNKGFVYDAEKMGVILFNIEVEVLVFSPQPGHTLVAHVNEIRPEEVRAMVFQTFPSSIKKQRLLDGSQINKVTDNDRESYLVEIRDPSRPNEPGATIRPGTRLKYAVLNIEYTTTGVQDFFCIDGSMRPARIKS